MRLTPKEPAIPEVGGFTPDNDLFEYRDFGNRFADLVRNIDEPLVIALDGPWGSGKSVFIKQWAGLLREKGAAVIEFNAFQSDHYEDAFLALSAEIHSTAKKYLGSKDSTNRRYLDKAKKAGVILAPIALRVAAKAGTAGLLSLDDFEASGDAIKQAVKSLGNESSKVVEKAISERLRKASDEQAALSAYRETLSELADQISQKTRAKDKEAFPLIFIIDELDRCRPPFALSVIERMKHFFSVQNVCFVLVTHLPQLEEAVQGAYGAKFDAQVYLQKFYHLRVLLPEISDPRGDKSSKYIKHLWAELGIEFPDKQHGHLVLQELEKLVKTYELSLREIERVTTDVALFCAGIGNNRLVLAPLAAGLCVMRQKRPLLYAKARSGKLNTGEAINFLDPTIAGTPKLIEDSWTVSCWKFATGAEPDGEVAHDWSSALFQFNFGDPGELIPFTASQIESFRMNNSEFQKTTGEPG
jgi:hypothetical protein